MCVKPRLLAWLLALKPKSSPLHGGSEDYPQDGLPLALLPGSRTDWEGHAQDASNLFWSVWAEEGKLSTVLVWGWHWGEGSCSGRCCQQALALVTSLTREMLLLFCTDEARTKLGMTLGEGQIEGDPTWSDLKVYHSVTAIFFNWLCWESSKDVIFKVRDNEKA